LVVGGRHWTELSLATVLKNQEQGWYSALIRGRGLHHFETSKDKSHDHHRRFPRRRRQSDFKLANRRERTAMICLGYQCLRPDRLKSTPFSAALSISDEYCDHLPETWTLTWTDPSGAQENFSTEEVERITRECTKAFNVHWHWPSILTDLAWAHDFHRRWAAARGYGLYAIACAEQDLSRLCDATRPSAPTPGFSPMGALGIHIMALRVESVDSSWQVIGWEILAANPCIIGECLLPLDGRDSVTGLYPTFEMAHEAARLGNESVQTPSRGVHIPVAILSILERR
jgi:hypothetical protein